MIVTVRRRRPALLVLLAATAVLYLWDLGASGWANPFYSAAVQAGATSWKAFFFGSSDAANAITVDKTPASLWPMALTARIFGVGSWSILVPQALMGVASVATLYAAVRRSLGRTPASTGPALLAGAALAVTPVAALMFRFNNPDALLVLMLTLAAYALVRAQEHGATRWLVLCGAFVGLGFLAKMMQAFLVVPVFALVYLATAPVPLLRRLGQLLAAGAAMLVAGGWWVAIVALVPGSARPYIGGSQNNSVLELALGYNGLGRLNGDEVGGLGNLDQDAGWARMFGAANGGQISWLLPAALVLLVAGLWATRRAARTDALRAGLLTWGGWLLFTAAVFSLMRGIYHEYYTVALAPAVAATVGLGTASLWERRRGVPAVAVLAATVAVTALWAFVLLGRTPDWNPWLRPAVLIGGVGAAAVLVSVHYLRLPGRAAAVSAVVAAGVALAAPTAYAVDTVRTPHTGAIVTAGPRTSSGPGRFGGPRDGTAARADGRPPAGRFAPPPGGDGMRDSRGFRGQGGRGPGGLLNATTPGAEVTKALKENAGAYTWIAATVGSNNAAGYQLATGLPVMAVGGFNGTDPAPTLERFKELVRAGRVHYFIAGGDNAARRATSGSDAAQKISEWVAATFPTRTVGGVTLHDLTQG
ncbi:ArnT family glycosyltransferase [Actinomadura kijaniata]|uniref:ArnT family glycosyltransferase n=1 Tax=Actinomadura kijaniata TaxID=46161 RepID=UPI0008331082|nr:glycosyltransferase family 39 protein [Actinomadura kijaniata]